MVCKILYVAALTISLYYIAHKTIARFSIWTKDIKFEYHIGSALRRQFAKRLSSGYPLIYGSGHGAFQNNVRLELHSMVNQCLRNVHGLGWVPIQK